MINDNFKQTPYDHAFTYKTAPEIIKPKQQYNFYNFVSAKFSIRLIM